jgi:predicted kinase
MSTDATRIRLGYQGRYEAEEKSVIYDAFFSDVTEAAKTNPILILDGSFSTAACRAEALSLGRKLGRPVRFFYIHAEMDRIKERLKQRRENSEADLKVYRTMAEAFVPYSRVDAVKVDTTVDTPEKSCKKLLQQLRYEPAPS